MERVEFFKMVETELLNFSIDSDDAAEIADSITEHMDEEGLFDSDFDNDGTLNFSND